MPRAHSIYNKKHNIRGVLVETGYQRILFFEHAGESFEIGLANGLKEPVEQANEAIDACMDVLAHDAVTQETAAVSADFEDGSVTLQLSDRDDYYFHALVCAGEQDDCKVMPHVGTSQDSFLIWSGDGEMNLRYFPHWRNIEFYCIDTDDRPFFVQNVGDRTLYVTYELASRRYIVLHPGDRKELTAENVETFAYNLPN